MFVIGEEDTRSLEALGKCGGHGGRSHLGVLAGKRDWFGESGGSWEKLERAVAGMRVRSSNHLGRGC